MKSRYYLSQIALFALYFSVENFNNRNKCFLGGKCMLFNCWVRVYFEFRIICGMCCLFRQRVKLLNYNRFAIILRFGVGNLEILRILCIGGNLNDILLEFGLWDLHFVLFTTLTNLEFKRVCRSTSFVCKLKWKFNL